MTPYKPTFKYRVQVTVGDDLRLGLYCMPALVIIGIASLLTESYNLAGIAASGAVPIAFGANKRFEGNSLWLLALTALGLTLSAWLGSLAGGNFILYIFLSMIYAACYSLLTGTDRGLSWSVMQSAIVFMMAGHYHSTSEGALIRGGLTGAGALLQLLTLSLCAHYSLKRSKPFHAHGQINALSDLHRLHLRWTVLFATPAMAVALVLAEHSQSFSDTGLE